MTTHHSEIIEIRPQDLVIRIAHWTQPSIESIAGERGYDVEIFDNGVYNYSESKGFPLSSGLSEAQSKQEAMKFAQQQIAKLLR